jgi:cytochrome c oxidase subunit IV
MDESHPQERQLPGEGIYFTVFLALAALTVTELMVTYLPFVKVPLLLALAFTKAWLVVQFYMHLRYDNRLFSFILALPVTVAVLVTIFLQILVK